MKVLVIGGGIGGLATALSLHAAGIECTVFEQSRSIRELGVGINLLPHAVKELASLDLLDALDRVAIRTQWASFSDAACRRHLPFKHTGNPGEGSCLQMPSSGGNLGQKAGLSVDVG